VFEEIYQVNNQIAAALKYIAYGITITFRVGHHFVLRVGVGGLQIEPLQFYECGSVFLRSGSGFGHFKKELTRDKNTIDSLCMV